MWLLAVSFIKWMLCSKSPSELGHIASLLWGTCWKCLSQDFWGWGWRKRLFTVCYRVLAWNQPVWSSKQSCRPAVCFPACLCSREQEKEAEISRDALEGTFAIPWSRRAAEKILVSFTSYKLLHLSWYWQLDSLCPPLFLFFCNISMSKGCVLLLSLWAVSQGQVGFFVSSVQYLHLLC